uniref:SETH1 n=1 Tax=Arundo donax TaxID=35708 RepID=A0A0A9F7Q2_ARUDO
MKNEILRTYFVRSFSEGGQVVIKRTENPTSRRPPSSFRRVASSMTKLSVRVHVETTSATIQRY